MPYFKLTWQPAAKHTISVVYQNDYSTIDGGGLRERDLRDRGDGPAEPPGRPVVLPDLALADVRLALFQLRRRVRHQAPRQLVHDGEPPLHLHGALPGRFDAQGRQGLRRGLLLDPGQRPLHRERDLLRRQPVQLRGPRAQVRRRHPALQPRHPDAQVLDGRVRVLPAPLSAWITRTTACPSPISTAATTSSSRPGRPRTATTTRSSSRARTSSSRTPGSSARTWPSRPACAGSTSGRTCSTATRSRPGWTRSTPTCGTTSSSTTRGLAPRVGITYNWDKVGVFKFHFGRYLRVRRDGRLQQLRPDERLRPVPDERGEHRQGPGVHDGLQRSAARLRARTTTRTCRRSTTTSSRSPSSARS